MSPHAHSRENNSSSLDLERARTEDAAHCASLVSAAFSARKVFRFPMGKTKELRLLQETVQDGIQRGPALKSSADSSDGRKRDLRGNRNFLKYAWHCCAVLTFTEAATERDLKANSRLLQAVVARIKLQYEALRELGIPSSVISRRLHRYSLEEATRRVELTRKLFGRSEQTAPLTQTAVYRVFSGSFKSPSAAQRYYLQELKRCQKMFKGPELAPLARTAAFLVFSSRFKDTQAAFNSLEGSLKQAEREFGSEGLNAVFARSAARAVFLGREMSVAAFKTRFDAVAPECRRLFGAEEETRPVTETAIHLILSNRYQTPTQALAAYKQAVIECTEEFSRIGGGTELIHTAARLVFEKSYTDAKSAAKAFKGILAEVKRATRGNSSLESMAGTVAYAVFAKRSGSVESAVSTLSRLTRLASGRTIPVSVRPYGRMMAALVFNGTYSDIPKAVAACRARVWECERRFSGDPKLKPFAATAAGLCFGKRYKDAWEAGAALKICVDDAERKIASGELPKNQRSRFITLEFAKRHESAQRLLIPAREAAGALRDVRSPLHPEEPDCERDSRSSKPLHQRLQP